MKQFELNSSLEKLRELTATHHGLTSMANLVSAARTKGLSAEGVQLTLEDLKRLAPTARAILYLEPSRHYVLLEKFAGSTVTVFDPGAHQPQDNMPIALLEHRWKGKAIVLSQRPVRGTWCRLDRRTLATTEGGAPCQNSFQSGGSQTSGQAPNEQTNDPVQLANGNLSLAFQDLLIPARGDVDLELTRTYNAQLNSPLGDWTPEGGAGSWIIERGNYVGYGDRSLSTQSWSDFTLQLDLKTTTPGTETFDTAWINVRYTDEDNRYYCLIHQTGEVELAKRQGGVGTFIAKATNTAFNPLTWNRLKIVAQGARLQIFVNGSLQIDYVDPTPLSTGKVALESHFCQASYDNITVTSGSTYSQNFNQIDNDFLFGNHWTSTYDRQVSVLPDTSVLVLRSDGRRDRFQHTGSTYVAPPLVYDTLAAVGSNWTLRSKHGTVETYSSNKISAIADRNGNTTGIAYGMVNATAPAYIETSPKLVIDDFNNATANLNSLGRWTDDNGTLVVDQDMGGAHKLQWNNVSDYWYSTLETTARLDASSYQRLTFKVKGAVGGERFTVQLQDGTKTAGVASNSYVTVTTSYQTVTIPLSAWSAQGINLANLKAVSLAFNVTSSGTIFIDDLSFFTPAPASNPVAYQAYRPLTVTDPSGRTLTLAYGANGKVSTVTDPLGRVTRYAYSSNRNLTTVTDPRGKIRTYAYTPGGIMTSYTDRNGKQYQFTYYYNNHCATQTDPVGNTTTFDYQWDVTIVTNQVGEQTTYQFDPTTFRLMSFTDPLNQLEFYAYDANQHLSSTTNKRGAVTLTTYDAKGNLLSRTDPLLHTTTFVYEPTFSNLTSTTDPLNHTTNFQYDVKGNLTQLTDAANQVTTFTYNAFGSRLTQTDPLTHTTTFGYNANGDLTLVTDPLGHATTYAYDAGGRRTSTTDALSHATTFGYDATNNLTSVTDALGNVTSFTYDNSGNLLTRTEPGNATTTYTYDALNNLKTVTDPLNKTTTYAYDAVDFMHKGIAERTAVTDANTRTTAYTYNADNRLTKITDAAGRMVQYAVDGVGNVTAITDQNGRITQYQYNGNNQVTLVTYPNSSTFGYDYDAAGNLQSTTDPRGVLLTYSYDALNRLTTKTYPDTTTVTYTYDPLGRMLNATNATGAISHVYDAAGRLTQVTYPGGKMFGYTYDNANRRSTLVYPGGPTVTYTYDNANRLTGLQDLNNQPISVGYDTRSRRTSLTLPNGVATTYGYNAASYLTSLTTTKGAATLSSFAYTYDNVGNRSSMTDAAGVHTYTYDPIYQLTQATNPTKAYAYDPAGNRTVAEGTSYTTNTLDQYTNVGSASYTYDAAGNPTGDGTATYAWDFDGRLSRVVKGATTVAFTYDALGRRASKTVNSTATKFLYDGAQLLAETNGAGTLTARTLFGPRVDEPLERKGTTTHYYAADGLSSIAHLTNATGAIAEKYTYDTFGKLAIKNPAGTTLTTSALGNRFTFTGREWDSETGLYDYRARYYKPTIGRFLSRDPLGQLDDVNLYRYLRNNPINYADPFGLDVIVLNDSDGAHGFGHNGIAVGNDEDGWSFYSQDGPPGYGGRYKYYNTANDLIADQRSRYDRSYRITSSPTQDQQMREAAQRNLFNPYQPNPFLCQRYQCADLVNDTLEAGGIPHGPESFGNPPNDAFEAIKDANPPGQGSAANSTGDNTKK